MDFVANDWIVTLVSESESILAITTPIMFISQGAINAKLQDHTTINTYVSDNKITIKKVKVLQQDRFMFMELNRFI